MHSELGERENVSIREVGEEHLPRNMEPPCNRHLRADTHAEPAGSRKFVSVSGARIVKPARPHCEKPHSRPPDEIVLQFRSGGGRGLVVGLDDASDDLVAEIPRQMMPEAEPYAGGSASREPEAEDALPETPAQSPFREDCLGMSRNSV